MVCMTIRKMELLPPAKVSLLLEHSTAEGRPAHLKSLIVLAGPDGRLLEWNLAFEEIKAALPEAIRLQDFVAASGRARFHELFRTATKRSRPGPATLELLTGQAETLYECLLSPLSAGNFLFLAEVPALPNNEELARLTHDLQEVKKALHIKQTGLEAVLAQVDEIAHTDQLTFLSNQRKIVGDLQRRVTQAGRSRKPLTIFLLDIDRFKHINDTFGHLVGDKVLRTLSAQLRESIRQTDSIGRYGGEEFLILLPGTALESAIPMAERLLTTVRSLAIEASAQIVSLTVSIGIAEYHKGETWKEFLERADKALYESKNNGRDDWTVSKCPDA